ncbi:DUF2058 domain-containing protein [Candidatus Methylospira mobilis]|uniref:DUF2058 domain-containing protein n=1 Tax=Candidatus Methylospira mobilis TaxID=1808979 RepID=A0A5Q0BDJ8_9GAMM|nr:DUF2058 domain-containing protein [Candidatus Methylospira mobilis]QFY41609.1 DUF2058 domain-containing protein [Candidatus Methylospira mobilis]WNV05146.1 DUF2058 domain-containing protein [Candidatus Methylospira mobilis]
MSNALRDQLLKAGLVNSKQVKQAAKSKQQEKLISKEQKKPDEQSALRQQAMQAQNEKVVRDRQLNQQRKEAAEARAIEAQIKQLVDAHRLPIQNASDIPFNFTDQGKIKRLYIPDSMRAAISNGQMAIVRCGGIYDVVHNDIATKIAERHASSVVLWNKPEASGTPNATTDPYAGYEVPDDLMW